MSGKLVLRALALAVAAAALSAPDALASGGTPPPPLNPFPCATVTAASVNDHNVNTTNTMTAQVTSCSSLVQSGLYVVFDGNNPGVFASDGTGPIDPGFVTWEGTLFSCEVVVNGSKDFSPGSSSGVACSVPASVAPGINVWGQGTASVYSAATGTTPLASARYGWSIFTPLANGGGTINNCTRTFCIP